MRAGNGKLGEYWGNNTILLGGMRNGASRGDNKDGKKTEIRERRGLAGENSGRKKVGKIGGVRTGGILNLQTEVGVLGQEGVRARQKKMKQLFRD